MHVVWQEFQLNDILSVSASVCLHKWLCCAGIVFHCISMALC